MQTARVAGHDVRLMQLEEAAPDPRFTREEPTTKVQRPSPLLSLLPLPSV